MDIPIYIDGKTAGRLSLERQGAVTVLDARLENVSRVLRLWVFGAGEPFYLGVPSPEGTGLRLLRRASPAMMKSFPADPAYAAEREEPAAQTPGHVLWLGGRAYYF